MTYDVSTSPSERESPSTPRWLPCCVFPRHPDAALRRPFLLITTTVTAPQSSKMTGITTPAMTVELSGSLKGIIVRNCLTDSLKCEIWITGSYGGAVVSVGIFILGSEGTDLEFVGRAGFERPVTVSRQLDPGFAGIMAHSKNLCGRIRKWIVHFHSLISRPRIVTLDVFPAGQHTGQL